MASPSLKVSERSVLCHDIERGHQRIAQLAAFSLTNIVRAAIIVVPGENTGRRIELPHVGKQRLQLLKYGSPREVVLSADGINGRDGGKGHASLLGRRDAATHSRLRVHRPTRSACEVRRAGGTSALASQRAPCSKRTSLSSSAGRGSKERTQRKSTKAPK